MTSILHGTGRHVTEFVLRSCSARCCTIAAATAVVLFTQPAFAQTPPLRFQRISLEQGLSQSIVVDIVQDRRGFMWFATEDGLNNFDGYRFRVLRSDPNDPNSLSYNQITAVYEDTSGVLWVGTFNGGLNRYDPTTEQFTHFRFNPENPHSICSDIVLSVIRDREGALWVGTDRGLNRFTRTGDERNESPLSVARFQHDPRDPASISNNTVRALLVDRSGTLWVGTDAGLNRVRRDGERFVFEQYLHDPRNPTTLSNDTVRALCEDRDGNLWIGTDNGLNRVILSGPVRGGSPSSLRFVQYHHNPRQPGSLSHDQVYAILEDAKGSLWVGTNGGGLNRFDKTRGVFLRYRHDARNPTSLGYDQIQSLFEDRSGCLWIGTYGRGISKLDAGRKAFVHYRPDPDNPNSLNQPIVWALFEDEDGILWIGTHGGGLNRFDRIHNRFTHYLSAPNDPHTLSSNIVRLIIEDHTGLFWIGTNGGGICSFDRATGRFTRYVHDPADSNSISHNDIRDLYEDRSGTLWITTQGGGLNKLVRDPRGRVRFVHYRYHAEDSLGLGTDYLREIYEDRAGNFWIGSLGGGLHKFDRKTGKAIRYTSNLADSTTLSNDYIFSLYEDSHGRFWVGTWGGGLNLFDRSTGKARRFTEEDGLPSNAIYGMLEDREGNLWLPTNNGLSKFNPETETFRNYSVEDGLQAMEFDAGALFESKSGEMFIGGINGFNTFFPEDIKDNPFVPPVVVTSFSKLNEEVRFDRPISEMKEIRLTYQDYVFSFEFSALDYHAPEKNRYAYRMEGLDNSWFYVDAQNRVAHYTTLPPGGYVFRVKGSNNDGVWNEVGTSVRVIIEPPFWSTWWFRFLVFLALAAAVAMLYRRRLKIVRLRAELQAAHTAQMSIMPQSDPKFASLDVSGTCVPANEVGGDFFDYPWTDPKGGVLGVLVGDVSGKAMNAAMTAVLASGAIDAEARRSGSPDKALTAANRLLFSKTEKQVFISACLALIDSRRKTMTFTNAGLNEPLLKREGNVGPVRGAGARQPLGLLAGTTYKTTRLKLRKGDVLVFVTDGVTEAKNRGKEFYGDERLRTLLGATDTSTRSALSIRNRILDDVKQFSARAPQHDDMTVVVIKIL